jgi:GrpB-like predicted nucleotidyltransferase (UPF0157 family)
MTAVVLSPYSSDWPVLFQRVREEVLGAFAPQPVRVEHIGSTSVPGLSAKPVIDMLLGAASLAQIEAGIGALERLGYVYRRAYETELPMRRYFVKAPADSLRVHLHGVVVGSPLWREHLAFRDALRADDRLRDEYRTLKQALARTHARDKAAYTEAKGPFIRAVLARHESPISE